MAEDRGWLQPIVRGLMETLLEDHPTLLTHAEISGLTKPDYCKNVLKLKLPFPLLSNGRMIHGYPRYWAKRYGGFYVCSQWQKDHHHHNALMLRRFVERIVDSNPGHPGAHGMKKHGEALKNRNNVPEEIVETEWNWNVEMKRSGDYLVGREDRYEVKLKGRCKQCWGELIARGIPTPAPTAIRCLVCGIQLEGPDAREEYQAMEEQEALNSINVALKRPPEYRDDATFVFKTFPYSNRHSSEEFHKRIERKASEGPKKDWLTRSSFPAGSVGFLFMQAKLLMSGIERLPRDQTVAQFPDLRLDHDGSAAVHWSMDQMGEHLEIRNYSDSPISVRWPKDQVQEHPKIRDYDLMKRFGSTMNTAMTSAFACELAMKAIRLARLDEARKSHDLWKLYGDLPDDSKARIKRDFSEVASVLETGRHTFGGWRYFETSVGERGMGTMIDTDRAFALAKAARVLIDEAEVAGLSFLIDLKANKTVTKTGDQRDVHIKHKVSIKGREHWNL